MKKNERKLQRMKLATALQEEHTKMNQVVNKEQ